MHPAYSIIVFTTLSGLGYGLAAWLGLGLLDPAAIATRLAHVVALGLIGLGLLSSTLHLGNPQRAWRALSQWRSSWLSREGVMAIVTFVPLVIAAWGSVIEGRYWALPGLLGIVLSGVTVYCTAMIYASLRTVDSWATPLTPASYLLFSAAGGALLAALAGAAGGGAVLPLSLAALALLAAAWAVKLAWRRRARSLAPTSTPESATQLGGIGRVRLMESPHQTPNYLTREMGYRVARKHADKLFGLALLAGGALPFVAALVALALGAGAAAAVILLVGIAGHAAGMLTERWLFFAEARHAVSAYYDG
ncbi:dimethyl sulfoxide reductase anchor subunit [Aquibium sp. A9E412]|uniref:dimethyl sulfoxide reductase anchor subunit family protein n=1 Tax=Aquibium sp. A9E412 TaxID=2976767 RepID=UPI0025B07B6D|nr:DmsC/YnfH family molybdoenzyme membrane anchor subunit [Aquibium sp. A9E412]MDN2566798.1 dimethyl sulfoxide reductase anchor subunit [Aquibium sp. A9E412]